MDFKWESVFFFFVSKLRVLVIVGFSFDDFLVDEPATPPFEKISVFFFFRLSDFVLEYLAILLFLALGCFSKFLVSTSAILC